MVRKVDWAKWKPQKDGGKANGSYSRDPHPYIGGKAHKIVLIARNYDKPEDTMNFPTHFSLDPRANGAAYQHVDLDGPAYRLGTHTYTNPIQNKTWRINTNRDSGEVCIQVDILGLPMNSQNTHVRWWDDDKLKRLAWWLARIADLMDVPKKTPFGFFASYDDKNKSRVAWNKWNRESGVMGMMHSPYDDNLWSPGLLAITKLNNFMNDASITETPTPHGGDDKEQVKEQEAGAGDDGSGSGDGSTPDDGIVAETSMVGKPFRFNPPLHVMNLPQRVDLTSTAKDEYYGDYFDERSIKVGETEVSALRDLRLGRIIQHEFAAGMAALNEQRMGFRFLYNPTDITVAASRYDQVVLDPRSSTNAIISGLDQNFQTVRMMLLLNRMPDVLLDQVDRDEYNPVIEQEDLDGIRRLGTHWDLEYLYRVTNGTWTLTDRGPTADVGILFPSGTRMLLGPGENWYGFVENIEWEHQILSRNLVPALTYVTMTFRRIVDMDSEEMGSFSTALDTSGVGGGSATGGDSDDATPEGGVNSKDAPVPGYNTVTRGYAEGIHRGWDYGGGGINNKDVHCTQDGVVYKAVWSNSSYGNRIIIKSGDIYHYYCHLSTIAKLGQGASVKAGDYLGKVGSTGNSTGPHLHYEERVNNVEFTRRPQWAVNNGSTR